jgi:trk system potassium uptake protein TrkH
MNLSVVQRILGILLMVFSLSMLPPLAVSLWYADGNWQPFLDAFLIVLTAGFLVWWPSRKVRRELRLRDAFLVVASFWVVLGLAGAVPLIVSERPVMSFTHAVFEAVSGFTTTGATVLVGLDTLPRSVLYYRQQIQWLGGMGIVILAIALLPVLGVGGMSLYKAETPGPVKDEKLTPRITQTAKALWLVYVGLTAACALAYWLAGMSLFDAIGHSFSTLSTGGFSPYDASMGQFASMTISMIAVAFMFMGAVNFSLHFLLFRNRSLRSYWRDSEFRGFVTILLSIALVVVVALRLTGTYPTWKDALHHGLFQVVSIQTSTGFLTANFAAWPGMLPVLVMLSTFVGGCAGSTAGGMKAIRWVLVGKQASRELKRLVHPSGEFAVKLAGKPVPIRVIDAVWGFFTIYLLLFGLLMLLLMATGVDQVTAWSAIATCMNNAGPGLNQVASNFQTIPAAGIWVSTAAMLFGRLEIFTLLVLLTPTFWQK